jgi:hypothetical protein
MFHSASAQLILECCCFIVASKNWIIYLLAPPVLQTVLETVRPVAGQNLRSAMKIFGTEQRVWKKYLLSIIPPDQLDMSMGGTKIDTH